MDSSPVTRRRVLGSIVAVNVMCGLLTAAAVVLLAGAAVQAAPAGAPAQQGCSATETVVSSASAGPGSLPQAVADVCAGGTVNFDATLAGQTITYTQITIDKNVTISGTVPLTLSGNDSSRIFQVGAGTNVTLYGLTLTKGRPGGDETGGAINNFGTLTVTNSFISGSVAGNGGGGGAIYNGMGVTLTVSGSRITGNASGLNGGGIANYGLLTVRNSTIDANQAGNAGGGLFNAGTLTVMASTVVSNQALFGAGIQNANGMAMQAIQVTVSGNSAAVSGGGLYNYGSATLSGSVLSGNSEAGSNPSDCYLGAPISSGGYNVVSDDSCGLGGTGDLADAGPQTLSLQPNGTAPLAPAAAARGSVNDAVLCGNPDQLGYTRLPVPCDAGAVEAGLLCQVTSSADTGAGSLRQAVAEAPAGAVLCFSPGLTGQAIVLGSPIAIEKSIAISGNVPIILDGNSAVRIFDVSAGGSLSLHALTLRNGKSGAEGGGGIRVASGGAVAAGSVTFSGNQSTGNGGAILNSGTTTISHGTFRDNTAAAGGAVYSAGGTVTMGSSVLSQNGISCGGAAAITSGGYNVAEDDSCNFTGRGDINRVPQPVGPAGVNGLAPLTADSLAVNNVTDPPSCTGTDQAGRARPTPCAAGALEYVTAATTRFVAPGGTDGGNDCASAGSPCGTLARALEVASDGSTIRMAGGAPYIVSSQPISKSVLILGDGAGQTILQAGAAPGVNNGRVLKVVLWQKVSLYGVTVRHGGSSSLSQGGGILNWGTLTVRNSAVLSNTVLLGSGAGIYNGAGGLLVVYNSTLAGNRVVPQVAAEAGGPAGPTAIRLAAGSQAQPSHIFVTTSIGMQNRWPVDRLAQAGRGGAIFNGSGGRVVLRFATLAGNSAGEAGGGFYNDEGAAGAMEIGGSVLSQNEGGSCGGAMASSVGASVSSDMSCGLSQGTDANGVGDQVGGLLANGTAPLLTGSGAVDGVPGGCPQTDQAGAARPQPCDSGAAESSSAAAGRLLVAVAADAGRPYLNQIVVFTATVRNTGAGAAANPQVSLTWPNGLSAALPFGVTGGAGCSWQDSVTLTCTSLAARSQVELVIRGQVTTNAVGSELGLVVAANAAVPAVGGTGRGSVITNGPPPPPPLQVGSARQYKTIGAAVNAAAPGTTIAVDGGVYVENVVINKSLTIRRNTAADVPIVDGNRLGSVFTIGAGSQVTLDGLTIRNGSGPAGLRGYGQGGGIQNGGALTVSNCTIYDNRFHGGFGAGIYSSGTLTVNKSTISDNVIASQGFGGGICSSGILTVSNSTLIKNGAERGGGIASIGVLAVSNSIFLKNSAKYGGAILLRNTGSVRHSTFTRNMAPPTTAAGSAIRWVPTNSAAMTLSLQDSIFSGNGGSRVLEGVGGAITAENSLVQQPTRGSNNILASPLHSPFVRMPSPGDNGDLRLAAGARAIGLGRYCTGADALDIVGSARKTPTCDAGAYEYQSAGAGPGQVAAAAGGTTVFANEGGAVTLTVPQSAAAQEVELAFGIGGPTGGDGRTLGVTFIPYDVWGRALGEDFTFLKPLQLTLEYDPALVTHGPEDALLPARFEPDAGSWLPFTEDVVVDTLARTVSFPITQAGEYGLFSFGPGVHVAITPFKAGGTANLAGGSTVLYTLAVVNANYAPAANLVVTHALPPGLSFSGWVNRETATENGGVITWHLPALAGGGAAMASFNALVSAGAGYQGQAITSTVTLVGAGGLAAAGQASISINGPTTPVADDATTPPDTPVTVEPLLNDLNPDDSRVLLTGVGVPAHGTATVVGAAVLYTPTAGFAGSDTFAYQLQDGQFPAQSTITVRVARLAFLGVDMSAASARGGNAGEQPLVAQGSTVIYTIQLDNMNDGEIAQNAVLTDVLPVGVQFTRWITQSGATLNGRTITWSAPSMPLESGITISYAATVRGAGGAAITSSVQAAAANADGVEAEAAVFLGQGESVYLPLVRR